VFITGDICKKKLEEEIERANWNGSKFSVIMLDIDHFKKVNENDTFGYNTGDLVLKSMRKMINTKMINNRMHKIDCLAKWGGEEFVILLLGTDLKGAILLAEDLRQRLSQMEILEVGKVIASFGITDFCPGGCNC